jgi:hypothetical protein
MYSLWRLAMWGLFRRGSVDAGRSLKLFGYRFNPVAARDEWLRQFRLGVRVADRTNSQYSNKHASSAFLPGVRRISWLLLVGCLSIGGALYIRIRYFGIEQGQTSLACYSGLETTLCTAIRLVTILFRYSVFGWTAVLAAFLNLIRPSMLFFSIGLAAAGFGLVLHNTGLSGLAVGLLILSLSRRASATE